MPPVCADRYEGNRRDLVGFEVLTAVVINAAILWDIPV
jgi:hypothetical protein